MSYLTNPYMVSPTTAPSISTADTNAFCTGAVYPVAWLCRAQAQTWDGTDWTSEVEPTNMYARQINCGRGNSDDYIMLGGNLGNNSAPWGGDNMNPINTHDDANTWNGTAWTQHAGVMLVNRGIGFGMSGNSTGGFINGGQNGSGGTQYNTSESFDSTPAFTTEAPSDFGGQYTGGSGNKETDFLHVGGYGYPTAVYNPETEVFDGSSWTCKGQDYPYGNASFSNSVGASGEASAIAQVKSGGTLAENAAKFDGNTWTNAGTTPTLGTFAGGGDSSNYIGGMAWETGSNCTYYNGTAFSVVNSFDIATSSGGCGANT